LGKQPFRVVKTRTEVMLKGRTVREAIPLDMDGYQRTDRAEASPCPEGTRVQLPEDTFFTILR
jgi:hypothetical protein